MGIKDHGQKNENGEKDVKSQGDDGNQNSNSPKYNSKDNGVSLAIASLGGLATGKNEKKQEENQNNEKNPSKGTNLVNNSINESMNRSNNNNNGGDEK
jgi:hypothetical protein